MCNYMYKSYVYTCARAHDLSRHAAQAVVVDVHQASKIEKEIRMK